jgi:hypothetical protein
VRTYPAHILEKQGLSNRVQATAYALHNYLGGRASGAEGGSR